MTHEPIGPIDARNRNDAEDALTLTVHAMPRARVGVADAAADSAKRRRGRVAMMLILLACAAPVIASYMAYFVVRPDTRTNYADLIEPLRTWPDTLPLTTLDGAPVSASSLKGQWLLVAMGGAACDEACEKRLFTQRQLREMLGRERHRVDKVFIVLDGGAPRPELVAALAAQPPVQMLRAPRAGLATWLHGDATSVDAHLYVVDPMGNWMMRAPTNPDPAKFKRDLERLLRASSSWDRAGR